MSANDSPVIWRARIKGWSQEPGDVPGRGIENCTGPLDEAAGLQALGFKKVRTLSEVWGSVYAYPKPPWDAELPFTFGSLYVILIWSHPGHAETKVSSGMDRTGQ